MMIIVIIISNMVRPVGTESQAGIVVSAGD